MLQESGAASATVSSSRAGSVVVDPLHVVEALTALENRFRYVFARILTDKEFSKKYDVSFKDAFDGALYYLFTMQPTPVIYVIEAFPIVQDQPTSRIKRLEELTYHWLFEEVIERYTKSRKKPNPVLLETRSADFCNLVTIKIEAIPVEKARRAISFMLLREFQVLQHIWENYRADYSASRCNTDQLVGFPMPFEFQNIDNTEYDLPQGYNWEYYSPSGKLESLLRITLPSYSVHSEVRPIKSSLSYTSMEKVGPSLSYLMDLMLSQGKHFSLSSALKVYDQLICRLMIMHKYSVVHGDVNPAAVCFGTGEAVNVLYISNFESSIIVPTNSPPLASFHDRFVSFSRIRERSSHFVHDLESAFYVLLYLLLGRLPWDGRLAAHEAESSLVAPVGAGTSVKNARSEKSLTVEDKEKFWFSSNQLLWMVKSIDMEFRDTMYRNFACDIVESLYARVKESIATCQPIGQAAYAKAVFVPGSAPYNAYFGVRKIIASYFRFESRNNSLKDPVWSAKIDILLKDEASDKRIAWDLSSWCWNYLDTSISGGTSPARSKSNAASRS